MPLTGEASRVYHREWMRRHRESPEVRKRERARQQLNNRTIGQVCEVCGFAETTDIHHEGTERKEHILCPNCHALITRGVKTMEELKDGNGLDSQPVCNPNDAAQAEETETIVQPNIIEHKCSIERCIICNPEYYREWFLKNYGREP